MGVMDATVGDDECNCIVSRRSLCYNNDIVSPFSNESCRKVFVLCREGGHKTVAGHGRAGAVMSGGRLLTPKEQVEHLKAKGVTFNLCSEQEAERFLTEHSGGSSAQTLQAALLLVTTQNTMVMQATSSTAEAKNSRKLNMMVFQPSTLQAL